jgi:hypothetical protein
MQATVRQPRRHDGHDSIRYAVVFVVVVVV